MSILDMMCNNKAQLASISGTISQQVTYLKYKWLLDWAQQRQGAFDSPYSLSALLKLAPSRTAQVFRPSVNSALGRRSGSTNFTMTYVKPDYKVGHRSGLSLYSRLSKHA